MWKFEIPIDCGDLLSSAPLKAKKNRKQLKLQAPLVKPASTAKRVDQAEDSSALPPRARWAFRLAALTVVPVLVLVFCEVGLRLVGYGDPIGYFLKTRVNKEDVYIENQRFGRRFFPPPLVRHPQPCLFEAHKPTNAYRIFILGESAAMGDPDPAFGFGRALEALLEGRYPGLKFEVANTAITAINSHVILPIARDCSRHEGDLWVIYMGNNEVVGPYGAGTVFGSQVPSLGVIRASVAFKGTKIGQWFTSLARRLQKTPRTPVVWGGMEMFLDQQVRADDPRMARVYAYFRRNLTDIIRAGVNANAKVLVSTLASNLKDCAPFASRHRPGLAEPDKASWEKAYNAGIELAKATNYVAALARYEEAARIDNSYADLAYRQGKCCWALSQFAEARRYFEQARDADALRFRADRRINDIIREVTANRADKGVFLVDGEAEIARQSPHGIPGDELLYEHVHLTWEGNYALARALAEKIMDLLPRPPNSTVMKDHWLTEEECAQRLAMTEWDRYQSVEIMWRRMHGPPFTHQLDWAERVQRWQDQLTRLRPQTKAAALKRTIEIYRLALAQHPDDWILHNDMGRVLQADAQDAAALEAWRQSLHLLPQNAPAYYGMGNIMDAAGKSAEAEPLFREALRLRPEFPEALNGLGLCLVNQGKYASAVECYRAAIQLNAEFAEGRVNLGLVLSQMGKQDEAIEEYQAALHYKPNSPSAHINLGKLLAARGKTNEAADHYAEAVKLAPEDPIAHFNFANALAALGRAIEATAQYNAAIQCKPDFLDARLNLGLTLARQGKNDEALAQFNEAVRLKPDSADAHFNLAVAYTEQRNWNEAIRHFQEVIRLDPKNAQARASLDAAIAIRDHKK